MNNDTRITRIRLRAPAICLAGSATAILGAHLPLRRNGEAMMLAADIVMLAGVAAMTVGLAIWICAAIRSIRKTLREEQGSELPSPRGAGPMKVRHQKRPESTHQASDAKRENQWPREQP